MSDLLPEKIWYQHRTEPFNLPSYDAPPGGLDTVEYIRSDLADAQLESLQREIEDRVKAHNEIFDAFQKCQREKDALQSLADTAGMDAERAIARADKAELDLKCLQESTVDAKAYQALQRENEELREKHDALWMLLDDIDTADDMFKEDHKAFQGYAYRKQRERFAVSPEPIGSTSLPKAAITPEMRDRIRAYLNWSESAVLSRPPEHSAVIFRDLLGEQG